MNLYPAIDLRKGRCVRLYQGDPEKEDVFSDDPLAVAKRFVDDGARRLHVVDLEGAFKGCPVHTGVVARLAALDVRLQVGGGVRSLSAAAEVIEAGADRIIVGTRALRDRNFLAQLLQQWPGRVVVSADVRDGRLAVEGWQTETDEGLGEFLAAIGELGVREALVTDISRDGTMAGVDVDLYEPAAARGPAILAAGGIASLDDLRRLQAVDGLAGAVVGRALYTGDVDLKSALMAAQPQGQQCRDDTE